jgi:hypothetical protein
MTDKAVVRASYSDYRRVRSRKVLQLVFEVPLELEAETFKRIGYPGGNEDWFALARLQEVAEGVAAQPSPSATGAGEVSSRASPVSRRPVADMAIGSQIALACHTEMFQQWIRIEYGVPIHDEQAAEEWVLHMAGGAERKRDVDPAFWSMIHDRFEMWVKTLGMP